MVSIIKRMTKLRALLGIRLGPGAAILPPEVTKIHLLFASKLNSGHYGPRKFWRNYLPRLKYHNPAVPMSINRTTDQDGPATMTIYFADSAYAGNTFPVVSSATSSETPLAPLDEFTTELPPECSATIDMKNRHESEILSQLLSITKAIPIEPTLEELGQIKDLEEQRQLGERDSKRSQLVNEKRRRKEAMLAQARGDVAAAREV